MAERLVFLHGFTQTHHHWHACANQLAYRLPDPPTLSFVDLPGHGLSDADRTPIDEGRSLAAAAGSGTYVGYSLGGRWALSAAVAGSPEIDRLVLIGATAGIADDNERAERVAADAALAAKVEQVGVEAFVDQWLAAPMFAGLPDDPEGRRQRLSNTAAGLASSLRLAGTGAQTPIWDQLHTVDVPVLVLAGAGDHKFAAIGERLADALPNATRVLIDAAGHAAHLEQPERVADTIAGWLLDTRRS